LLMVPRREKLQKGARPRDGITTNLVLITVSQWEGEKVREATWLAEEERDGRRKN